jgi:hypothetical protein
MNKAKKRSFKKYRGQGAPWKLKILF